MRLKILRPRRESDRKAIAAIADGATCDFEDHLQDLSKNDQKLFARVSAQLEVIRQHGRSSSMKRITDYEDLNEFRVGDLRVICFYDTDDNVICLSMFEKRSKKGLRIRQKYEQALMQRRKWRNRHK